MQQQQQYQGGRNAVSKPGTAYYKTKLCSMWESTGACPYGDHCSFAHGNADLREVPHFSQSFMMNRKTKPCNKFNTPEGCPYGDSCNFLHGEPGAPLALPCPTGPGQMGYPSPRGGGGGQQPQQEGTSGMMMVARQGGAGPGAGGGTGGQVPMNYKTRLCVRFSSEAGCPFGEKCHFAHGQAELRDFKANQMANQSRGLGMGGMGGHEGGSEGLQGRFNPPNAPVTFHAPVASYLFRRRDLNLKAEEVLTAPPAEPDSLIAKLREANQQKSPEEWLEQGGSDIYGDRVTHLVAA